MTSQVVLAAIVSAVALQRRHQVHFFQTELSAIVRISQLPAAIVSDDGANSVVEKRSILHQLYRAQIIFKAAVFTFYREVHGPAFTRLHRRIKFVDPVVKLFVVLAESGARNIDVSVVILIQSEMDFLERIGIGILDHLLSAHNHVAGFWIHINRILHGAHAGLGKLLILLVLLLVVCLTVLQSLGTDYPVQNSSVVPDPCPGGSKGEEAENCRGYPATMEALRGVAAASHPAVLLAARPEHHG